MDVYNMNPSFHRLANTLYLLINIFNMFECDKTLLTATPNKIKMIYLNQFRLKIIPILLIQFFIFHICASCEIYIEKININATEEKHCSIEDIFFDVIRSCIECVGFEGKSYGGRECRVNHLVLTDLA